MVVFEMKRNIDDAIRPEVSGLVSLAILIELVARLSTTSPELRTAAVTALQAAAAGMLIVTDERQDEPEKEMLRKATDIIEEIHKSLFGVPETGKPETSH